MNFGQESSGANGYSISEDRQYFLARTGYVKQWRHSYNATYKVYDVKRFELCECLKRCLSFFSRINFRCEKSFEQVYDITIF